MPRPEPKTVIADPPAIVVPPAPEADSRREQLKQLIDTIDAPDLERAMPIFGVVQTNDPARRGTGTPISGATIVLKPLLDRRPASGEDPERRLVQWIEREVQEKRMTSDRWQTTSDENGRFEFTGLSLTRYLISAKHPRWYFSGNRRSISPGSVVVIVAIEPSSSIEVDLQVRLADGSIPARAEVAITQRRMVASPEHSSISRPGRSINQQSTLINRIARGLEKRFRPWTPSDSTRKVSPGYYTVIARSSDGQLSDPVEVFIEKSSGKQRIVLEIIESGSIHIDLVQSTQSRSNFNHFVIQIDEQRPPPVAALLGGTGRLWYLEREWPRVIPRVPPGAYLVGIGSDDVIWGYQFIEVGNQRVDVLIDLTDPTEGNFIIARVVDGQGKPIKAAFRRRVVYGGRSFPGYVDSILKEADGLYRIALTVEEANAKQFFLTATTETGSIELEVGDDVDPLLEFRFGSSAGVKLHYSGLDDLWRVPATQGRVKYSLETALVPPGEVVGPWKWQSLSKRYDGFWGGGFHPSDLATQPAPGFLTHDLGTFQGGNYDLVVGIEIHHHTLEVLRVPITVGDVDLEIPVALPPLYPIEVLQTENSNFTIIMPDGKIMRVFLDKGETTVTLPAGTYEFSLGPIKKTIDVPRHRQIDLRGEE